jgi:hypothetical protein
MLLLDCYSFPAGSLGQEVENKGKPYVYRCACHGCLYRVEREMPVFYAMRREMRETTCEGEMY